MKINVKGIDIIKHYEGLHDGDLTKIGLQPKPCPRGIWTAGWGHAIIDPDTKKFVTIENDPKGIRANELFKDLTLQQANDLLASDLERFETWANNMNIKWSQNQFDAVVSFMFNIGVGNFKKSNVFRLGLFNVNNPAIRNSFMGWNKSGGKVYAGLTARRKDEADLYFSHVE